MTDGGTSRRVRSEAAHPGQYWRDQMERRGITQAQMARQTGASHKHINQILQGNALPSEVLIIKMARVLYDDASQATQHAWALYTIQGKRLFDKAFRELDGWEPLPDLTHRGSAHDDDEE